MKIALRVANYRLELPNGVRLVIDLERIPEEGDLVAQHGLALGRVRAVCAPGDEPLLGLPPVALAMPVVTLDSMPSRADLEDLVARGWSWE